MSNEGWIPSGPLELATSVGLALVHPDGQEIAAPEHRPIAAIAFNVGCECSAGHHPSRPVMVTWRQLACLEGQMAAWLTTLPTNLRDQYAAERAHAQSESEKAL